MPTNYIQAGLLFSVFIHTVFAVFAAYRRRYDSATYFIAFAIFAYVIYFGSYVYHT